MNASGLIQLFVFPGLLFAIPAGWFYIWGEHKAVARMQQRIGPPMLQPFYDFVKLLGKRTPSRRGIEADLLRLWPALSVLSLAGALALLPVFPSGHGFSGDGILLVALLELPSICFILAGFTSGSIYGEIGAHSRSCLERCQQPGLPAGHRHHRGHGEDFSPGRSCRAFVESGALAWGSSASCCAFPRS